MERSATIGKLGLPTINVGAREFLAALSYQIPQFVPGVLWVRRGESVSISLLD